MGSAKGSATKPPKGSVPAAGGQAQRFFELFAGLDRVHGRFDLSGKTKRAAGGTKQEGKASLVKKPLTVEAWARHLKGEIGLGVVPIRDDATCRFGAVDVDVYGIDLEAIEKRVQELSLPLVVCRTKSGGAHLYCFGSEDLPADLLREKLGEMAVALGYAGVEIFPKQSSLAGERDFGSWINMPYFDAAATNRYAIGPRGGQLDVAGFLDLAKKRSVTVETLRSLQPNAEDQFPGGPPCLQSLAIRGFPEGSRNNALYNIVVYLRKSIGDGVELEEQASAMNQLLVVPPLGPQEVLGIVKSVRKKSYNYKCKEAPISSACSRGICLNREHGIRGAQNDPGVTFGELTKLDTQPPMYLWDVNGERLELSAAQLMDQKKFNLIAFEVLDVWPQPVRPDIWAALIRDKLTKVEVIEAPEEASRKGRIWQLLEDFCTSRAHGLSRDELLTRKPWTEDGWTYFRLPDFLQYLENQRVRVEERDVWLLLRAHGAKHGRWNLKGKQVKWWAVEAFSKQTEPLDVPRAQEAAI